MKKVIKKLYTTSEFKYFNLIILTWGFNEEKWVPNLETVRNTLNNKEIENAPSNYFPKRNARYTLQLFSFDLWQERSVWEPKP